MKEENKGKGGYRPGSGRPPQKTHRVSLSVRVKPSTLDSLKKLARNRNKSVGYIIDRLSQIDKEL